MNKKRIFTLSGILLVLGIVLVCFFCCKGKKDAYCTVIPKDATALMRLDVRSIAKDYDIDFAPLKDLMGKEASEAMENLGIDFTHPVYAFYLPDGKSGLCARISSASDLKSRVEQFAPSLNVKMSEKDGYTWLEQYGSIVAFDNDRLVALFDAGLNGRLRIKDMMVQTEEQSVLSTSMTDLLAGCDKPLALVASTQSIPSAQRSLLSRSLDIDSKDFEADMLFALDFVKDKAILTYDLIPRNKDMKEELDESLENVKPINGKFFSKGLANPFALVAFGLNGEEIYDDVIEESGLEFFLGKLDLHKAVRSLQGDVCLQAASPDASGLLLQAEVTDRSLMDIIEPAVQTLGAGAQVMRVANDQFCLSNGMMPIFLGIKDSNLFYVATGTDVAAKAGHDVESWTESYRSEAVGNYFYATVDASALVAFLKQRKVVPALLMGRLSQFDRLTLKVSSATHAELSLSVKDGKDFVETLFK